MSERGRKRAKRDKGNGWEESGGYMAAKVQKLEEQVQNEKSHVVESDILKGVAIFVNGYTKPSSFELKRLVITNGGVFHHYYIREKVSHIIASNLPNSKVGNLTDKKVCKPEWIADSIDAGRLLPYQDYLLYAAKSKVQPGINFGKATSNVSRETAAAHPFSDLNQPATQTIEKSNSTTELDSVLDGKNQLGFQSSVAAAPALSVTEDSELSSVGKKTTPPKSAFRSPSKAGDESFVSEFYSNSRLHHLSTWGAEFKAYINKLQQESDHGFPARDKLRDKVGGVGCKNSKPWADSSNIKKGTLQRLVMHIDMDCFFVSVGLRNRPELIGKPVAVTHSKGKTSSSARPSASLAYEKAYYADRKNGKRKPKTAGTNRLEPGNIAEDFEVELDPVEELTETQGLPSVDKVFHSMAEIASCSYEARALGLRNGMFVGEAKKLCPDLVTIPYDFEGYNQVSKILYDTVASYTHDIEAVSCDEMLVDCTDLMADTGATPGQFAELLRAEIRAKTACNASAGIGPSILIARLATRVAKPNGQHVVEPEDIQEFIKDKAIRDLPGVGWSMSKKLQQMGVESCGDLQVLALDVLQKELGPKTGQSLYNFCRGQDKRPITMEKERKSVSAEINYGIRFTKREEADKFITSLAEEVHNRLEKIGARGKTITLKVKVRKKGAPKETAKFLGHGVCDNIAKSVTIAVATDNPKVIAKETIGIMHPLKIPPEDFRGLGIQISRLETGRNQKGHKITPSILQFTTSVPPVNNKHVDPEVPPTALAPTALSTDGPTDENGLCDLSAETVMMEPSPEDEDAIPNGQRSPKQSLLSASPDLPPLPTLPDFTGSPETSFSELMTSNKASGHAVAPSRTPVHSATYRVSEDFMLPSPSQIDQEVLEELPPEIRFQIQSALEKKATSAGSANGSQEANVDHSQEAGCSHWMASQVASSNSVQSKSPNKSAAPEGPIEALPSYSQLDLSCLAALPADMRAELEKAYQHQRSTTLAAQQQQGSSSTDSLQTLMMARTSPGKSSPKKSPEKSPSKTRRQSPLFKVPRGRPPGRKKRLSPKKLEFARQPRIDKTNQPKTTPRLPTNEPHSPTKASVSVAVRVHPDKSSEPEPVNLCGAVTLTEVKAMMKEWVTSSEGPEEVDLQEFVTYLAELVHDKNLEQVDLLLKYLYRLMQKKQTDSWMNGTLFVLDELQSLMQCVHGARLTLPSGWRNIV